MNWPVVLLNLGVLAVVGLLAWFLHAQTFDFVLGWCGGFLFCFFGVRLAHGFWAFDDLRIREETGLPATDGDDASR